MRIGYLKPSESKDLAILAKLKLRYPLINIAEDENVDVVLVIGGDGALLHALHYLMHLNKPFYGINNGSIGFLMNKIKDLDSDLIEHISSGAISVVHPLRMNVVDYNGVEYNALAVNEVSIFRRTNQSAKFKITVDKIERMQELVADGALVCTPAGSTAYNLSAGGAVLPLESNMLCLTPICPFRPRRWQGALLKHDSVINFEILEPHKRPVSAVADFYEFHDVASVTIKEASDIKIKIIFNRLHSLEDRIIKEQFFTES
jgi:NAD+ kinase